MTNPVFRNMTLAGIEAGYPPRTILDDAFVGWDVSLPDSVEYGEPVTNVAPAQYGTVVDKLRQQDLDVTDVREVAELARMSQADVAIYKGADFAAKLATLRFPLGRTGLNGVGIFYEAGPSQTADMIVFHRDGERLWTPLVFTRNRWNTPGGFMTKTDTSPAACALREFREETGHDLASSVADLVPVLAEVKPSDRSTDYAWVQTSVHAAVADKLFEVTIGPDADDAKAVRWCATAQLDQLVATGLLSAQKLAYIQKAARACGAAGNSP